MTVILAIMLAFVLGGLCTLGALWFFVGRSEDEEFDEWLFMNEKPCYVTCTNIIRMLRALP